MLKNVYLQKNEFTNLKDLNQKNLQIDSEVIQIYEKLRKMSYNISQSEEIAPTEDFKYICVTTIYF